MLRVMAGAMAIIGLTFGQSGYAMTIDFDGATTNGNLMPQSYGDTASIDLQYNAGNVAAGDLTAALNGTPIYVNYTSANNAGAPASSFSNGYNPGSGGGLAEVVITPLSGQSLTLSSLAFGTAGNPWTTLRVFNLAMTQIFYSGDPVAGSISPLGYLPDGDTPHIFALTGATSSDGFRIRYGGYGGHLGLLSLELDGAGDGPGIPTPAALALLGAGLVAAGLRRR